MSRSRREGLDRLKADREKGEHSTGEAAETVKFLLCAPSSFGPNLALRSLGEPAFPSRESRSIKQRRHYENEQEGEFDEEDEEDDKGDEAGNRFPALASCRQGRGLPYGVGRRVWVTGRQLHRLKRGRFSRRLTPSLPSSKTMWATPGSVRRQWLSSSELRWAALPSCLLR